jgi:hypothetical protein
MSLIVLTNVLVSRDVVRRRLIVVAVVVEADRRRVAIARRRAIVRHRRVAIVRRRLVVIARRLDEPMTALRRVANAFHRLSNHLSKHQLNTVFFRSRSLSTRNTLKFISCLHFWYLLFYCFVQNVSMCIEETIDCRRSSQFSSQLE